MSIRSVIAARETRVLRHTGTTGCVVSGAMCGTALVLASLLRSEADDFYRVEQLWCFASAVVVPFSAAFATMRLFAGERRDGTLPQLLAAPVTERDLVKGKFMAALRLVWLSVACGAIPLVVLTRLSNGALRLDTAAMIGSCIFLAVHSALFTALGVLCSSFARGPVASACTMLLVCGASLAAWFTTELSLPMRRAALPFDGPGAWIADCALGHIPPMPLLAGLVLTSCLIFVATRILEAGRWR